MVETEFSCSFFGHRDAPENIKEKIKDNVVQLIREYGVKNFFVGHNGRFDSITFSVLKELSAEYPFIVYSVVLSYLSNNDCSKYDNHTLFPEGIENVPKRFRISWRNKWMIDRSQYIICYVTHITGGAFKCVEIAERKSRTIINIS